MSRLVVAVRISIGGCVGSSRPEADRHLRNRRPDRPRSADLRPSSDGLFAGAPGIQLSRPTRGARRTGRARRTSNPAVPDREFSRATGTLPGSVVSRSGQPVQGRPRTTVRNARSPTRWPAQ